MCSYIGEMNLVKLIAISLLTARYGRYALAFSENTETIRGDNVSSIPSRGKIHI